MFVHPKYWSSYLPVLKTYASCHSIENLVLVSSSKVARKKMRVILAFFIRTGWQYHDQTGEVATLSKAIPQKTVQISTTSSPVLPLGSLLVTAYCALFKGYPVPPPTLPEGTTYQPQKNSNIHFPQFPQLPKMRAPKPTNKTRFFFAIITLF